MAAVKDTRLYAKSQRWADRELAALRQGVKDGTITKGAEREAARAIRKWVEAANVDTATPPR